MSAASPRAWRRVSSTASSALVLAAAVAGCGGGEPELASLPPDVGAKLSAAAAEVTAALEAGDPVAAQAEADELLASVEAALGSGDLPRPLAREVRRGAERLAALVAAAQPPPPPPAPEPPPADDDDEDDDDNRGNGKDKGKGKDKDKDGDGEDDD